MLKKILITLALTSSYKKLLDIALEVRAIKQFDYIRFLKNETKSKKDKVIYNLIKKANELNPKLQLNEMNYKKKLKQYSISSPKKQKDPTKDSSNKKNTGKIKLPVFLKAIINEDKTKKTDEQYAKWFYSQPEKIQNIYKTKGTAYRKRGKLHTALKKITGTDERSNNIRKEILDTMNDLTLKIKQLHSITLHYEKTNEIILV